jgi:uncharacterized ferritin-like protein (DUF455 family)
MEGPDDTAAWSVTAIEGVSEGTFATLAGNIGEKLKHTTAFVEPTVPITLSLPPPETLTDWACLILNTADPDQKVSLTREAVKQLRSGAFSYPQGIIGQQKPPAKPPRLAAVKGARVPKGQKGFLHNVTHIEQWAIDLAWDLIARFARPFQADEEESMPLSFFEDWATIAEEEAKHFTLLRARLEAKGSYYGEYKTQDGLWDSAVSTAHDIKARLSIVCLVHEARGLDVNPQQIDKFRELGDHESVTAMTVVHADEISHVAAGHRYLTYVCEKEKLDPVMVFRNNVKEHFKGKLKGPFNAEDRGKAGMREEWYAGDWQD